MPQRGAGESLRQLPFAVARPDGSRRRAGCRPTFHFADQRRTRVVAVPGVDRQAPRTFAAPAGCPVPTAPRSAVRHAPRRTRRLERLGRTASCPTVYSPTSTSRWTLTFDSTTIGHEHDQPPRAQRPHRWVASEVRLRVGVDASAPFDGALTVVHHRIDVMVQVVRDVEMLNGRVRIVRRSGCCVIAPIVTASRSMSRMMLAAHARACGPRRDPTPSRAWRLALITRELAAPELLDTAPSGRAAPMVCGTSKIATLHGRGAPAVVRRHVRARHVHAPRRVDARVAQATYPRGTVIGPAAAAMHRVPSANARSARRCRAAGRDR